MQNSAEREWSRSTGKKREIFGQGGTGGEPQKYQRTKGPENQVREKGRGYMGWKKRNWVEKRRFFEFGENAQRWTHANGRTKVAKGGLPKRVPGGPDDTHERSRGMREGQKDNIQPHTDNAFTTGANRWPHNSETGVSKKERRGKSQYWGSQNGDTIWK